MINPRLLTINRFICTIVLVFILIPAIPSRIWGVSRLACLGAVTAEYLLPGLGYGLLGDYDKMLIFGGARWAAANKALTYMESDNYEEFYNRIYREKKLSEEKTQVDIYLSRDTFYGNAYAGIYGNLTFATFYDLYDKDCEENNETYGLMFAPFQIWEYWDEPNFWAPTLYAGAVPLDLDLITYHVDKELTRREMLNLSFLQYQLVGIGEEMLFRGVIQRYLYNLYSLAFSSEISRWSSIITASVIFGAAHSGQGFTATPLAAFGAGLYLGWVYHPAEGDFDLTQAIAIHSWWDTILVQRRLQGAKFTERDPGENALNSSFRTADRVYPLFGFNYSF